MKSTIKKIQQAVGVTADGVFGEKTLEAVAARLKCTADVRVVQHCVGAAVDGIGTGLNKSGELIGDGFNATTETLGDGVKAIGKGAEETFKSIKGLFD
jgi:hypothetical protein